MRARFPLLLLLVPLLAAGLVVLVLVRGGTPAGPREEPDARAAPGTPDLRRLESRVASLEAEIDRLREDVRRMREAWRGSLARGEGPTAAAGGGPPALLDEWVASFGDGGSGSEFYRLAVDAHAGALVEPMLGEIADASAPVELRRQLLAILGTPRFRGDDRVVNALLETVRTGGPALAAPALEALRVVGDERAALALERLAGEIEDASTRDLVVTAVVQLSGDGANLALVRLLAGARTAVEQCALVARVAAADPDGALDLLREASRREVPVRLEAATRMGGFRTEPFQRLVEERLAEESDLAVRAALERAREIQRSVPSWNALKATGPPDATPPTRDHPNAWATRTGNMGRQWIELTYETALRASAVRIFEVNVAGAVVEVQTVDESGERRTVWSGEDPTTVPGVFEVTVAVTARPVKRVRVVLDTDRRSGWNEIDAVELVGPDGRAWAADATASSNYGQ